MSRSVRREFVVLRLQAKSGTDANHRSVSEMPHKIPHYAALLARLSLNAITPPVSLAARIGGPAKFTPAAGQSPPRAADASEAKEGDAEVKAEEVATAGAEGDESKPAAPEPEKVNIGHAIVQDLAKAFQAFLDERRWKSVRYSVSFQLSRPSTMCHCRSY